MGGFAIPGWLMVGQRIEVQRDVAADAADVWTVITEIERFPDVLRSVVSVERVQGQGFDVGVSWREVRRRLGQVETRVVTVVLVDPGRRGGATTCRVVVA